MDLLVATAVTGLRSVQRRSPAVSRLVVSRAQYCQRAGANAGKFTRERSEPRGEGDPFGLCPNGREGACPPVRALARISTGWDPFGLCPNGREGACPPVRAPARISEEWDPFGLCPNGREGACPPVRAPARISSLIRLRRAG